MSRCGWIRAVGYEEYECGITGVSVVAECANAARCIPRMARMYVRGMLPAFDRLDEETREAIMQVAKEFGGLGGASVKGMSEGELTALMEQVRSERQARARGKRQLPAYNKRLRRLVERRHQIDEQIKAVQAAIVAIEEGRGEPEAPRRRNLSEQGRRRIAEAARQRAVRQRAAREESKPK